MDTAESGGDGWYRTRVDLKRTNGSISVLMPRVDNAYTLYWDGARVGGFGDPERRQSYVGRAELFSLPAALTTEGKHTLAIQVWDRPLGAFEDSVAR
jgi:hypothetical protein